MRESKLANDYAAISDSALLRVTFKSDLFWNSINNIFSLFRRSFEATHRFCETRRLCESLVRERRPLPDTRDGQGNVTSAGMFPEYVYTSLDQFCVSEVVLETVLGSIPPTLCRFLWLEFTLDSIRDLGLWYQHCCMRIRHFFAPYASIAKAPLLI